ncbi:MAG: nucleotidyltransferase domain-containing protein [Candidatus Bilamarchaeaceae archaeon]
MLAEFRKFRGFVVLEFFLSHPTEKVSIRELAKRLKISTMSAKAYCDLLENSCLLESEKKGLAKFFSLRNEEPAAKQWKRAYAIQKLVESGMVAAFAGNPFYVYGSFADGSYSGESDVDIFLVKIREIDHEKLDSFRKRCGWELSLVEVPFSELSAYREKHKELIEQILKKGIYFGDETHGL